MAKGELTIAICTHNRAKDFAECLDALYRRGIGTARVLVIDSASSELEAKTVARLVRDRQRLDLVYLDKPGIALARNEALARAESRWVAFLDDDTVPAPDWVEQAERLIASVPEDCAVIGGRVDALYTDGCESNPGRRWRQLLSLVEREGEADHSRDPQLVSGNAIFRRDYMLRIGLFPPQLGHVGKVLLSGEEKMAVESLVKQGYRIFYSDRLRVSHKIPQARLRRKWAAERAYWDGVTDQKIRRLMCRPPEWLKTAKVAAALPLLGSAYGSRSARNEFFIRFWYNIGYLREFFWPISSSQIFHENRAEIATGNTLPRNFLAYTGRRYS
jgi:glycosyltransferase involved in cell wall biosynthesis